MEVGVEDDEVVGFGNTMAERSNWDVFLERRWDAESIECV